MMEPNPVIQAEEMQETEPKESKKLKIKPHSNFNLEEIFGKNIERVDTIISEMGRHVRNIEIPKKDGSIRRVLSPDGTLKYIQKRIYWKILRRYRPSIISHGFVHKRSVVTNAKQHVGAKCLGKIDIKNFFDSISEKHLKNCLFGNKNVCRMCKNYEHMLEGQCSFSLYKNKTVSFKHKCEEIKAVYIPEYCEKTGYQSLVTRIIKLCTYNGFTAQGFPTSPIIANIVMRGFDNSMKKYCDANSIKYTRYADDLAFSSKKITKSTLRQKIQKKAYRLLWAFGFKPNYKKTVFKSNAGRLRLCGIVINKKLSMQRSRLMNFRAEVHHAIVKHAATTTKSAIRKLKGFASYLMSIDGKQGNKYMEKLKEFELAKFKH